MKKLWSSLLVLSLLTIGLISCNNDDDKPTPTGGGEVPPIEETVVVVTDNITENTTWEQGKVYQLTKRIAVVKGATLTIEPGVIVKGEAGAGANATALIIARGAKIMAEGTEKMPIIFTSVADEIMPENIEAGKFESPNLNVTTRGYWGGLIILGNAKISAAAKTAQIEGIPSSDPNGEYGGDDDADNSGVLKYISIRHGGTDIGAGNEINGLTLGGVGSATVIENIEVIANADDGIEWFGGTVSVKNAVVWNVGDDGMDTDQSWNGTLDNFAVISVSGHAFELDGPEGADDYGPHTIKNGRVRMSGDYTTQDLINTDDNSNVNLANIFFTDLDKESVQKINRVDAPNVSFSNIYIDTTEEDLVNRVPEGKAVPAGVMAGTTDTFNPAPLSWTWAAKAKVL